MQNNIYDNMIEGDGLQMIWENMSNPIYTRMNKYIQNGIDLEYNQIVGWENDRIRDEINGKNFVFKNGKSPSNLVYYGTDYIFDKTKRLRILHENDEFATLQSGEIDDDGKQILIPVNNWDGIMKTHRDYGEEGNYARMDYEMDRRNYGS